MAKFKFQYRYLICFAALLANISQTLVTRNMVYTLPAMINRSRVHPPVVVGSKVSAESNLTTCESIDTSQHTSHISIEDGPYDWNQQQQALILGIIGIGLLIGAVIAMKFYEYALAGPVMVVSLCTAGAMNILLPWVASFLEDGGAWGCKFL